MYEDRQKVRKKKKRKKRRPTEEQPEVFSISNGRVPLKGNNLNFSKGSVI